MKPQINTNVDSFLLVFLFISRFVPRGYWQITFLMLNGFCLLRKTSHPEFLMDNIKPYRIPSKIKRKLPVPKVLQVLLIKSSFLSCCFTWAFTSVDIIFTFF